MGPVGREHTPLTASRNPISTEGGAKSGARNAPNAFQDCDLAKIVKAWPELPENIKAAIKALVASYKKQQVTE